MELELASCDSTCVTCSGPNPDQCTSCLLLPGRAYYQGKCISNLIHTSDSFLSDSFQLVIHRARAVMVPNIIIALHALWAELSLTGNALVLELNYFKLKSFELATIRVSLHLATQMDVWRVLLGFMLIRLASAIVNILMSKK